MVAYSFLVHAGGVSAAPTLLLDHSAAPSFPTNESEEDTQGGSGGALQGRGERGPLDASRAGEHGKSRKKWASGR